MTNKKKVNWIWFALAYVVIVGVLAWVWGFDFDTEKKEFKDGPGFAKFLAYLIGGGGGLLILQIYNSTRQAEEAEDTAKAAAENAVVMQKTVEVTEKGNIAERFKNAIEHLGSKPASIRLGGIYALHHIAQEVEEYRKRVFEILCAHIRETTTHPEYKILKDTSDKQVERKQPTIEIQSILNSLFIEAKGKEIYEELHANLESADLRGVRLNDANLQNAYLVNANLQNAYLEGAYLENAYLEGAYLENANLANANLQNAYLEGACLKDANLANAYLQDAYLLDAILLNANLSNAYLQKAHLDHANLQKANLKNTDLQNACLQGVYLMDVKHLEVGQLLVAETLFEAKLPDGMKVEIMKKKPKLFNDPDAK